MISSRIRESRRNKTLKLSRNLQRLYREGKCRKCSIVVTRMDFAKILGKFTKVKIQYESVSSSKKKDTLTANSKESVSPINARLKNNENGMVLLPRNAYNQHPAKDLKPSRSKAASPHIGNVLKENNRLKKTPQTKKDTKTTILNSSKKEPNLLKQYKIVFVNPKNKSINDNKSKLTLAELIPLINTTLLPSKDWSIDYLPKSNDIKGDKVYDRIAAELEDLMYNEKPKHEEKTESSENKVDDFPSIMDILNDTTGVQSASNSEEIKATLESSDVEAMLLGKGENLENSVVVNGSAMESGLVNNDSSKTVIGGLPDPDFPPSPSILNENETSSAEKLNQQNSSTVDKMDIDENTTNDNLDDKTKKSESVIQNTEDGNENCKKDSNEVLEIKKDNSEVTKESSDKDKSLKKDENKDNTEQSEKNKIENNNLVPKSVTHIIFSKTVGEKCYKSVTCLKNLKYVVELDGKQVEFIGAPKYISSLEDLKVLLQIVNESELESLYVLH